MIATPTKNGESQCPLVRDFFHQCGKSYSTASTDWSMARTITDHSNPLRSPADGHLSIRPGKLAPWFPGSTACPPTSLLIKQL